MNTKFIHLPAIVLTGILMGCKPSTPPVDGTPVKDTNVVSITTPQSFTLNNARADAPHHHQRVRPQLLQAEFLAFPVKGGLVNAENGGGLGKVGGLGQNVPQMSLLQRF